MTKQPTIYMLVGLPGAGKTEYAHREMKDCDIFSSDELREELFGDRRDQDHNKELFEELHKRIYKNLQEGHDTVYDATNINYKRRIQFIKNIPCECEKRCIVFAPNISTILLRNGQREHKVPPEVIQHMYTSFYIPWFYEGWDAIALCQEAIPDKPYSIRDIFFNPSGLIYYDQHNSHHTLSLGDHMLMAHQNALKYFPQLKDSDSSGYKAIEEAILLHDIGKVKTQVFHDTKGNPTSEAHYYGHHLVGAYDSLQVESKSDDRLYRAVLIQWHMQPYFLKSEKSQKKYRKLWGDSLYDTIMAIYELDKSAH